jgi:LmbE family N-acetylglucosaminyl deacetylase
MVIAPHPDDETVGCGGVMIRHRQAGDQVYYVAVTDGRRSQAHGLAAVEMAARRRAEADAAAGILGVAELIWLGLPEGEWQSADAGNMLAAALLHIQPQFVYAPSRIDFHPEHQRVAHATAMVLATMDPRPTVRVYPIQVPLTGILTNLVADTSPVLAELQAALNAYTTQRMSLERRQRSNHYLARQYGFRATGEAFWELPAESYMRLHSEPPEGWRDDFRGMRARPFSDPLAYLVGRRVRQAYRAAADR